MRTIPKKTLLQRRSTAPLPVVTTPRGLPELRKEAATFDGDLSAFASVVFNYEPHWIASPADVELVRRVGGEIDAVRTRWRALNRPATAEQIAAEMLMLASSVVTAGNLSPALLTETLCGDITELKPTFFALARGCRAVRANYEFLHIADVVEEIKKAERKARRYSYALAEFSLDDFEANLREEIAVAKKRALEWKAGRKRQKIAEQRQRKKLRRQRFVDEQDSHDGGDE
jgi:hypothetical protein